MVNLAPHTQRPIITPAIWEKRNYWVKADSFRMDWDWAGQLSEKMKIAVLGDDWGQVAMLSAQIGQKLHKVNVPENHRMGKPWLGAWEKYGVFGSELN
ncbi:MAG: hypothetical protein QGD88_07855 [Anaerolineae bacterium]|nr:hypothetical protein [Anaerolineae bacterium]